MSDQAQPKDAKKNLFKPVLELVPQAIKSAKSSRDRLLLADPFLVDHTNDGPILYQHSVLCQTCLAFRDPGDEVRQHLVTLQG